jgi:glutathione synthase/RimK-type ligase-like ATP-grasp enzyme
MYKFKGKMKKHKVLMKCSELLPNLPETHWLTTSRAVRMLKENPSVFIKPDGGTGGAGIIKIRKAAKGYVVRDGSKRMHVGAVSLYKGLNDLEKSSKKYIVQRGLQLARYKGKIFDVRMYLQKPHEKWTIAGMAARVAAGNSYVTNFSRGGHPKLLEKVLLRFYVNDKNKVNRCINKLEAISIQVAEALVKRFPGIVEMGIDLGIDKDGHIWIIEANSKPAHKLFAQLPDKTMLQTIRKNKLLITRRLYTSMVSYGKQ